MEESEIKIEDEIQDGGSTTTLHGTNTLLQRYRTSNNTTIGAPIQLNLLLSANTQFENRFNSKLTAVPNVSVGGELLTNNPLYLSDLLSLLDDRTDVGKAFLSLPIAQFKHLPDPSVLNAPPVPPVLGGQYDSSDSSNSSDSSDLSANPVYESPMEMSQPLATEETPRMSETSEEFPSLEVEEPISGGASKSRKWSSHKKRRHTRIRTKKNRKL